VCLPCYVLFCYVMLCNAGNVFNALYCSVM
jgi:hypothetical protein